MVSYGDIFLLPTTSDLTNVFDAVSFPEKRTRNLTDEDLRLKLLCHSKAY